MSDNTVMKSEILSIVVKLSLLSVSTFFTAKWLFSQLDPARNEKKRAKRKAQEQLSKIGVRGVSDLTEHEMDIASHLVDPTDIPVSWSSIAGLGETINKLKKTVIFPVQRKDLFADTRLTQPPKGVLLYGPPGCGKTMIAKAIAREGGMRFINLDISILTSKWYGESQKLASAVFSLAVKLQPCVIFIDEIDSFLRNRDTHDHEATAMMKAQFLSHWDGLITDPDIAVIVMGATNRPCDLDKAILRRMPAKFNIPLPKEEQRREILELILEGEPVANDVDIEELAHDTEGFSGSDLREMCQSASIYRIDDYTLHHASSAGDSEDYFDALRPITKQDLDMAIHTMRQSRVQIYGSVELN